MKDPDQINIALSKPAEGVTQGVYILHDNQKMPLLRTILNGRSEIKSILIFSSTKEKVKQLEMELKRLKYNVAAIHSDLEQIQRKAVLRSFSNRELQILVATDILSRGIDIDNIGMVINYDVPGDAEDYIHRVGRTARADTKGEAITFVGLNDQRKLMIIEELIEGEINRLAAPEDLGPTPAYEPKVRRGNTNFRHGGNRNNNRRNNSRR